jgi:flagellar biosynthesis regulator FlbT
MSEAAYVGITTGPADRYPEHEKQHKVIGQIDAIRAFVEFAQDKDIEFGKTVTTRAAVFEGTEECTAVQAVRGEVLTRLIYEHFGLDRAKILAEKEQMLREIAALGRRSRS